MKGFDESSFLSDLDQVPWDSAYVYTNTDDIWEHSSSLYTEVIDLYMPCKKKYIRGDQLPWITPEISYAISKRNRMLRKFRKNRTDNNWEQFRIQRNMVTSLKRKSLKSYFIQVSADSKHPGEFWSKFRPLLPSKGVPVQSITLLEGGQLITDPSLVANIFNNYFVTCVSDHIPDLHEDALITHPSVREIQQRFGDMSFAFRTVDALSVKRLLNDLKPNKATGPDLISPKVLRISAPSIAAPLTKLMNHCITSATWPSKWKRSNVSPIFKKDCDTDKENFRPVSVLTAISKILEKIKYNQMFEYIQSILSDNLSEFLKGHSCSTALLKMTEDFRRSLDDGQHTVAVAIDLSKAFDSISHSLLITKLKAYGFSSDAVSLIRSYLTQRQQRVRIGNAFSEYQTVKHGVPQGSILGPLLFNVFINDLNFFTKDVSLRLYADDTTEYCANQCPVSLQVIVQSNLDILISWFKSNYLRVNDTKTKVLPLGQEPVPFQLFTERNSPSLSIVNNLKLLGLTIDSNLTFKQQ